jgi:hypothetical protein
MRMKGRTREIRSTADSALPTFAVRQHGVVSIRQLLGPIGYTQSAVNRAVAAGRLHRLYRGVYAVGHTSLSLHARCLAAVLASGPGALLSHYSAGWLWDLKVLTPIPVHTTATTRRRPRRPIHLHYGNLDGVDRALREGIPVTSLARTLLDLAAFVPVWRLQRLLERSEELRLFELTAVEDVLARNRGHRGAGRLRRAAAGYRPPPFTRSGAEVRLLELLAEAGLPRPATGFNEVGYELDLYWPDLRFAVELDLFETHGTRESFERDRLRQEDLKLGGVEMTRVTGKRLEREPRQVAERIARLLEQRRCELGGSRP